jgi:Ca-activated chloride channel family protein
VPVVGESPPGTVTTTRKGFPMTTHEAGTEVAAGPALVALDGRRYPLESARAEVHAEGGIALTRFIQRFTNPHEIPLEVLYTLALPADGAVLSYNIHVGATTISGEIETRAAAEEGYLRALDEGRTASLLEEERADTFTQHLGNVPPHTSVEVDVEVLHPLAFIAVEADGPPIWEYRFPTVVGVRYEGTGELVPDARRLDVNRAEPESIPTRLDVSLKASGVPENLGATSPSHDIVSRSSGGLVEVSLAAPARLDRDLVVRWGAATPAIGMRVAEGRGLNGDAGRYALLSIVPPARPTLTFRRDLTVLMDASGSMGGSPLELAKEVVGRLLRTLQKGDRFEVLAFASRVERLTPGMVETGAESQAEIL